MKRHELKTWLEYFELISTGQKTFEVRRNDRDFQVGDLLILREWNQYQGIYTGRYVIKVITYIMRGDNDFLPLGDMVIMAINNPQTSER